MPFLLHPVWKKAIAPLLVCAFTCVAAVAQTSETTDFRVHITRLEATSPTSLLLRWNLTSSNDLRRSPESATEVATTQFRIYRNDQLVATLPSDAREFKDTNLSPVTVYTYAVGAVVGEEEIRSWSVSDITRLANEATRDIRQTFDIVVVGATPGGIAAALTAARFGRKVALVSPSPWMGGMMTGGLSRTDFGSMKSAGGIFKEFVDRVYHYYTTTYGANSPQAQACRQGYYFEPRLSKWIFHQLLAEQPNITVFLNHHPRGVVMDGNRVTQLFVLDRPRFIRKTLTAQVFIDATYEGDLAAYAGAAYRIGREGREEFNEQHAGELFWNPLRRQVVFGSGKGDRKIQAYNYRLCLTTSTDNFYPFPPPTQYDRNRYLTLIPDIHSGRLKAMDPVLSILPLPNNKHDANNHPVGNPSSDLIGGADEYPESDLWKRDEIAEEHRQHILGLLYFLQYDPEVPDWFRQEARRWGFAYDEFVDNNRFPTQLYVREGRRIVGPYIFTENDARSRDPRRRPNFHADSIAVADYPIDSHATAPEKDGLLEGFFYLPGTQTQPSMVPYRVMTPTGIEGVLVSGCVSCTHIGYGTLRLEPVFLSLGLTAGTVAHLSLERNVPPSQLDPVELQRALLAQKQVLCVFNDVPLDHPHWAALQYFGTKGFFPFYDAKPDDPITRADAAQWLWQWLQMHKPDLPPFASFSSRFEDVRQDHASYLAIHALRHHKVIPDAEAFRPEEPLTADALNDWLTRALRLLGRQTKLLPPAGNEAITRGQFCQRLFEVD